MAKSKAASTKVETVEPVAYSAVAGTVEVLLEMVKANLEEAAQAEQAWTNELNAQAHDVSAWEKLMAELGGVSQLVDLMPDLKAEVEKAGKLVVAGLQNSKTVLEQKVAERDADPRWQLNVQLKAREAEFARVTAEQARAAQETAREALNSHNKGLLENIKATGQWEQWVAELTTRKGDAVKAAHKGLEKGAKASPGKVRKEVEHMIELHFAKNGFHAHDKVGDVTVTSGIWLGAVEAMLELVDPRQARPTVARSSTPEAAPASKPRNKVKGPKVNPKGNKRQQEAAELEKFGVVVSSGLPDSPLTESQLADLAAMQAQIDAAGE